jgi:hypothetical protein
MMVVHHLNESRSHRILWLLEELQAPYEIAFYQRDARTNLAPVALREIHPLGKSPVITEGDRVIAEGSTTTSRRCLPSHATTLWPVRPRGPEPASFSASDLKAEVAAGP